MGPSGTGKTTLLRLIGGQLAPDSGRVLVDGHNLPELPQTELFDLRKSMGMLFQSGGCSVISRCMTTWRSRFVPIQTCLSP